MQIFSPSAEAATSRNVASNQSTDYLQNTGLCHCETSVRETSVVDITCLF